MDAENFEKLMKERHSVRYFQKKEIPQETLKKIISLALNSPSWCNSKLGTFMLLLEKPYQK